MRAPEAFAQAALGFLARQQEEPDEQEEEEEKKEEPQLSHTRGAREMHRRRAADAAAPASRLSHRRPCIRIALCVFHDTHVKSIILTLIF